MSMPFPPLQASLCNIRVDPLERAHLLELINEATVAKHRRLILHHNLHSLYLYQRDPEFAASYEHASWVYIDGLPIVWLGKAVGLPLTSANRITFLDCFDVLIAEAVSRGWRVFYLGGSEDALQRGLVKLRKENPTLVIDGHHGFFAKDEVGSREIAKRINDFNPDVLFVGMGMPIQEKWLAKYSYDLKVPAILTSGGTLDYVSGDSYRPPRWAGRLGLYGMFRLLHHPRRLWSRYLLEPFALVYYMGPRLLRQWVDAQGQ